ncbi:MAG: ABC transporter substrate-binding protein [Acidimicrobiia bacterium]|nr:ABC transporter substrate-binding protein [Acidimicrobiia bacterium]
MDPAADSQTPRPGRLAGAEHRFLKGYAPLALAGIAVVAVIAVFPSRAEDQPGSGTLRAGDLGQSASGWNTSVKPCPGNRPQVPGDSYSPPCFVFRGDNGGETSQGVSADEITVTYRRTAEPNVLNLLAALLGIKFNETPQDFERTMAGLVEYFNENFEFYGRRMKLEVFDGKGTLAGELTGGGQETATNDGLKAGSELEAFADITGVTQPYSEALVKQKVIAFGAPYLSREWFTKRRPFAWSLASDCSVVAETASTYGLRRLVGKPAIFAGGVLKDRPRKIAVISPTNPEYQQCTRAGLKVLEDAGEEPALVSDYVLDIGRIPSQAKSIAAQIVSRGITTISSFSDPLMMLSLTQELQSQGLEPEWTIGGVAFLDADLIGQGLAKKTDQWKRSFGLSPLGEQMPAKESPGYKAFKSVRPDEEPSQIVDVFYYQLYQLALGIQMAGPDLTPENFETGMFSYPVATGPGGTWDYFAGSYTPIIDAREIWWDPKKTSPFNGERGSYASTNERYREEEIPEGQPKVLGR